MKLFHSQPVSFSGLSLSLFLCVRCAACPACVSHWWRGLETDWVTLLWIIINCIIFSAHCSLPSLLCLVFFFDFTWLALMGTNKKKRRKKSQIKFRYAQDWLRFGVEVGNGLERFLRFNDIPLPLCLSLPPSLSLTVYLLPFLGFTA